MIISAKSSLILGENKAGFCTESHNIMMSGRMSDGMNDRMGDRMSDRMSDTKIGERICDRASDRMGDRMSITKMGDRMSGRIGDRIGDTMDKMMSNRADDITDDGITINVSIKFKMCGNLDRSYCFPLQHYFWYQQIYNINSRTTSRITTSPIVYSYHIY